ncbi:MAG: lipopolysaccharide biosynthesis protein [Methylomicrobium sp.]
MGLLGKFKRSQFAKDTATLTIGTALAQAIGIFIMPVLSRLYTPEEFGKLAVFMAVSGIVAVTVTLRYETHILLPKEEKEASALVTISLLSTLIVGSVLCLVSWLLPSSYREIMGIAILGNWLPIAILFGMGSATLAIGTAWLNRQRAYPKMAKLRFLQSLLSAIVGVSLGIFGYANGLLIAQLLALLILVVVFLGVLFGIVRQSNATEKKSVALHHSAAPKYLLPTALLDTVTQQLPIFLITAWFSSEAAGQFSMAWKILALPITLVGGAIGQVFFQKFSEVWPNYQNAQNLLFKTWLVLIVIGLIPMLLIILWGADLFSIIFGNQWLEAGKYASFLAPLLFVIFVSGPTATNAIVVGAQSFCMKLDFLLTGYRVFCFIWFTQSIYSILLAWSVGEIIFIIVRNIAVISMMKTYSYQIKT